VSQARRIRFSASWCLALVAALLAGEGCSTFDHAKDTREVVGRSLDVASPEGARRLALEKQYDSAVVEIATRMGDPNWIHIVSRDQIYLYYTEKDQLVVISRPMVPPGEVRRYEQIPGFLLNLLPQLTVDAVVAKREADRRAAKRDAKPKRARRARRSASPAAIAPEPDSAVSFLNFDPDRIVRRLRTPLSAADPGVTEWRSGRLPDGTHAKVATTGTTRYLVRGEAVSVSASIPPRGRSASARTRHAIHRLNQAIFGTRASAVDRRVEPLVSRVAADTSGRTEVRRRVAGRTVSLTRDTSRGLIIYSIHSK
jgi:hypothetical protein